MQMAAYLDFTAALNGFAAAQGNFRRARAVFCRLSAACPASDTA